MNGYLLDTHAAIWFFTGDTMLSPTAKQTIRERTNRIYLSVISAWELTIKISIGKLRFPGDAAGFMQFAQDNDIAIVPVETAHLTILKELPLIHRDPFDRLLVATAISEKMTIITADMNIARYDAPHIW
ncbi:MAG: type II toxin-antitoxin system VapC family toxin [Treponema sp.]|jgi:PIN domain nuclease of toxin-antitoxin system|nr:type II toxin-antitoxin system VapC family toxin [Treponema sp.]